MTGNYKSVNEELLALKEELQRVKLQTSLTLEAVGIGLWTMLPEQNCIIWDQQCQKIYGWPQDSVPLNEFLAHLHPQDVHRMQSALTNPPSRQTGKPTTIEYRIASPVDGMMRWIRITGRAIAQPGGDYFSGTAQDITDAKRREATLKKVEQRFQMAFTNASVGVVILDTQSNIQLINKVFADFVGYSQEELLDQHFEAITHASDVEENAALIEQLLRGETSSYIVNKRYVRKDGVLVWGQVSSALIRDEDGRPNSFISIVQDITAELEAQAEQKKLVALLETSEERLREAIELAELGTFDINLAEDTIVLSERVKGWFGFSPDETPGLAQVLDVMKDKNVMEAAIRQAVANGLDTALDIDCWVLNRQTGQERLYHA